LRRWDQSCSHFDLLDVGEDGRETGEPLPAGFDLLEDFFGRTWDPARLSQEVREYGTAFDIRRELRFNDLRGTKVTEMVWSGISVPDLAVRIGWKIETAAKMLGVYAALNPGRAMVVALPRPAKQDDGS
jgi:hypothetical protein